MVRRIIDRRGRKNWDDKTREAADRQVDDRRKGDRRKKDLWAGDPTKVDRRKGDRRQMADRRGQGQQGQSENKRIPFQELKVRNLVSLGLGQVSTLPQDSGLSDVIGLLNTDKIGLVVITNDRDDVIGVISERDIIRAFAEHGVDAYTMTVDPFLSRGVWTCGPDDKIMTVIKTMRDHHMRHMPVATKDGLIGMISAVDVMRYLAGLTR